MSIDIYELFKEQTWKPEDCTSYIWTESYGEVSWNYSNNLQDLLSGEGDTYSGEPATQGTVVSHYIIYSLHNGCGGVYQAIFDLEKRYES